LKGLESHTRRSRREEPVPDCQIQILGTRRTSIFNWNREEDARALIGERLLIVSQQRQAAGRIVDAVLARDLPLAVSIAGESGSGKSGVAWCLSELLRTRGLDSLVVSQDDYFRLPPEDNHRRRLKDLSWVGPGEVRLDLLDEHIRLLKAGGQTAAKPLVLYRENRIETEHLGPLAGGVVIVEGTYVSLVNQVDLRVFIQRDFRASRADRKKRGREPDSEFIDRVLRIEHEEISRHRAMADVIIQ
jgi:uridine kinase